MGNECPHCQRRARELAEEARELEARVRDWHPDQVPRNFRTGHTVVQGRRAQWRFRTAVRKVINLLRLRLRWSRVGQFLQVPNIRDLTVGLERRRGRLVRTRPAPTSR